MLKLYREMPAWRKAQLVADAIDTSRALALAGLRSRHPHADEDELRGRLVSLVLGEAAADSAYRRRVAPK